MIFAPALRIGNIHLIAQNIPDDSRLDAIIKSLNNRSIIQFRQRQIPGERAPVDTPENLFQQLPKLTFAHTKRLYAKTQPTNRRLRSTELLSNCLRQIREGANNQIAAPHGALHRPARIRLLARILKLFDLVSHQSQRFTHTHAERAGNGAKQFRARFLLPSLDLRQITEGHARLLRDLT